MKAKRTRKQQVAIQKGFIALVIGIIVGIAYLFKFFPANPINNIDILAVWSSLGWIFSALFILFGLCEIFIKGDL